MDIDVNMEELCPEASTDDKMIPIEVLDISKKGIGFRTTNDVEINGFYMIHIVFPTKERMDVIVKVVREEIHSDGKKYYGGVFVGISEADMFKIEVFRLFTEEERNGTISEMKIYDGSKVIG